MPDANPIFDLGNPIWIEVVKVQQTPKDLEPYAGRFLSVPNATAMPPLGTRGIVQVSGVQVPGYLRQDNGNYQWVMMPPVDPLEALIDALPGQPWLDAKARGTWLDTAVYLRGLGVPGSDLDSGLRALWNAERTELLKEYGVS